MPVPSDESPGLHGQGITLRPIVPDVDAGVLHAVFGDATQLKFMVLPTAPSVADTEALLRKWNDDLDSPQWAILDGEVVGRITLVRVRAGVYEIGVQVIPRAQGRGLARRAILLVTSFAFTALGACRVFGDVDPGNVACQRSFSAAGFRLEGTLVANWRNERGTFDSMIYAATAGWAAPR